MGEQVTFASNGDSAEGYLALPGSGSGPGVIVIQEWWGLVPHVRDVADRFAAEGFVALAPDLYHGATTTEPDEAGKLLMGMAMDRAAKDIAGAASYLVSRAETSGERIGAVGFCMGGSLALWSATLSPEIAVAVGFYPAVPWERMSPTWSSYDGKAAALHTAEGDGGPEAEGIQTAKRAIEAAGGTVDVYGYPGTEHAFFNDARPDVYDPEAAALAWERTLTLLRSRLP
ncbi:MAG TPA: dienelactone hydrolase family protein [Mycobacteriales bacterium]|jgi:carboxymethylenebutenolidase|nr:dienelactone hydrolase family protein [Mycobacteriales bacterium]